MLRIKCMRIQFNFNVYYFEYEELTNVYPFYYATNLFKNVHLIDIKKICADILLDTLI